MPSAFFTAVREAVTSTLRHGRYGWPVTGCVVTMTRSGYWPRQSHAHATFDKSMSSTGRDFRHLTPLVLVSALRQAGTAVCEPVHAFRAGDPGRHARRGAARVRPRGRGGARAGRARRARGARPAPSPRRACTACAACCPGSPAARRCWSPGSTTTGRCAAPRPPDRGRRSTRGGGRSTCSRSTVGSARGDRRAPLLPRRRRVRGGRVRGGDGRRGGGRPARAPVGRDRHAAGRHPPGVARVRTQLLPHPLRGDGRAAREVLAGEGAPRPRPPC